MKFIATKPALVLGLVALAWAGVVQAQASSTSKYSCMSTGSMAPEPVGDREGHLLAVNTGTCHAESGTFEGAIITQNTIWEVDKAAATMTSGNGVFRRPGGVGVYQLTSGTRSLVVQDGKVVGWTTSGKGLYTMATGNMSTVAGKTFSFTAKGTGFGRYSMESSLD